jgi:drug/metabolite transporter (DMT)-like permease
MIPQSYARGVLLVILAGVFLSSGGLIVRHVADADAWTILFYRSLTFSATVIVFLWFQERKNTLKLYKKMRGIDLLVTVSLALGFIFYLLSLFNTSVANTVLVLSTGPFIAALLGLMVLGEKVNSVTIIAMFVAIAGVLVMVSGGIGAADIKGIAFAFMAVLAFAVMIVTLRKIGPERNTMSAVSLAGFMAAAMCLPFVTTLQISAHDLLMAICLGSFQVGLGFILITLGSRSVPAAQVPLLALGETALSPLWVWLIINETPARNTLIGGALVLAAVLFQGLMGLRSR